MVGFQLGREVNPKLPHSSARPQAHLAVTPGRDQPPQWASSLEEALPHLYLGPERGPREAGGLGPREGLGKKVGEKSCCCRGAGVGRWCPRHWRTVLSHVHRGACEGLLSTCCVLVPSSASPEHTRNQPGALGAGVVNQRTGCDGVVEAPMSHAFQTPSYLSAGLSLLSCGVRVGWLGGPRGESDCSSSTDPHPPEPRPSPLILAAWFLGSSYSGSTQQVPGGA